MDSQPATMISYRLKKLMARAADGIDVADDVRTILELERNLRSERMADLDAHLQNVRQLHQQSI